MVLAGCCAGSGEGRARGGLVAERELSEDARRRDYHRDCLRYGNHRRGCRHRRREVRLSDRLRKSRVTNSRYSSGQSIPC